MEIKYVIAIFIVLIIVLALFVYITKRANATAQLTNATKQIDEQTKQIADQKARLVALDDQLNVCHNTVLQAGKGTSESETEILRQKALVQDQYARAQALSDQLTKCNTEVARLTALNDSYNSAKNTDKSSIDGLSLQSTILQKLLDGQRNHINVLVKEVNDQVSKVDKIANSTEAKTSLSCSAGKINVKQATTKGVCGTADVTKAVVASCQGKANCVVETPIKGMPVCAKQRGALPITIQYTCQ
jgi:hypothetical protein